MKIKKATNEQNRRIDVSEWSDEIEAYFKPLGGLEQLVFNDLFLEYRNRDKTTAERFSAAFKAAQMALVDADGAPIFTDADMEAIQSASFFPIVRVFNYGLAPDYIDERFKKN